MGLRITGDPYTPQARLEYARLADELDVKLGDILVDKGEGKLKGNSVEVGTHFGVVKFVLKHKISKDELLEFPSIMREYIPSYNAKNNSYNWVIPKDGDRAILYAAKRFDVDGEGHLVSVHRIGEGKRKPPFSQKISPSESSAGGLGPQAKIPPGSLSETRLAGGQIGDDLNIPRQGELFKPLEQIDFKTTSHLDIEGIIAEAGTPAKLTDAERLEANWREVEQMETQGLLTEEEVGSLHEARRLKAETEQENQGLADMLECLIIWLYHVLQSLLVQ